MKNTTNNLGENKVETIKNKKPFLIHVIDVNTPQGFKETTQPKQRSYQNYKLISTQYTGYKNNKF